MIQRILPYASYALTTPVWIQEGEGKETTNPYRKVNMLADRILTPVRYLFNDTPVLKITYKLAKPDEIHFTSEVKGERRNGLKTLLMIASFVPALILGMIGKAIALRSSIVQKDIAYASSYFSLHTQIRASNLVLAEQFKGLWQESDLFDKHLLANMKKGAAIWDEEATQVQLDKLLQTSARMMDTVFVELARSANNDAKKMAELLSWQPDNFPSEPLFCFCFFTSSIWSWYATARSKSHYLDPETNPLAAGGPPFLHNEPLTKGDEKPFFKKGTRQYAWRLLYNKCAAKLDDTAYTSSEKKTIRYYVQTDPACDNRCDPYIDKAPVIPTGEFFGSLPGGPSMSLPSIFRKR